MIELSYIDLLRLIVDFGLVILTWLVQLVIYPAFLYFQKADLNRWHPVYTRAVTWVVLPLMVSQLFVAIYQSYITLNIFSIIYLILVMSTWLVTFFKAVPLHTAIDNDATPSILHNLIRVHTYRTVLWTIIFGWSGYIIIQ